MASKSKKQRFPLGVGCLAFFLLLGSLAGVWVLGSLVLISNGVHEKWFATGAIQKTVSMVDAATMASMGFTTGVGLFVSIGLFKRQLWAWRLYLVMTFVDIGLITYAYVTTKDLNHIISIGFQVVILCYMLLPGVRKVFRTSKCRLSSVLMIRFCHGSITCKGAQAEDNRSS